MSTCQRSVCLTTFCYCKCSARSSPSLGPVCCRSQLPVYCNPADSFLWPHFYEFSISPLYCISRPFIKQYVAAMFAYFLSLWPRFENRSLPRVSAGPAALPVLSLDDSRVKVTWSMLGWASVLPFNWSILIIKIFHCLNLKVQLAVLSLHPSFTVVFFSRAPSSGCIHIGSPMMLGPSRHKWKWECCNLTHNALLWKGSRLQWLLTLEKLL